MVDAARIEERRDEFRRFGNIILRDDEAPRYLEWLAERAPLPLAGDVERLCAKLETRSVLGRLFNENGPEAAALIRSLAAQLEKKING